MTSRGSLCGYGIESDLPLRRLDPSPGPRGTVSVGRSREPLAERSGRLSAWIETPGGDPAFALARTADGSLICWFRGAGAFLIDAPGGRIEADLPDGPTPLWEHCLGATVMPLLVADRGDLVPHAAAVLIGGRVILICGSSGSGKSTLALALAAAGHPVLTEDGAAVELSEPAVVWPGAQGICVAEGVAKGLAPGAPVLDGQVRAAKRVYLAAGASGSHPAAGPHPVGAVVVLDSYRGGAFELEELPPATALSSLVPNLIFCGPDALGDAFSRAARLVDAVPSYRCRMPDRLEDAPAAAGELAARFSEGPPATSPSASRAAF